jgi:hypothetical protein
MSLRSNQLPLPERLADLQPSFSQVHVFPLQPEQFAKSCASEHRALEQGTKYKGYALDDRAHLFWCPRRLFTTVYCRLVTLSHRRSGDQVDIQSQGEYALHARGIVACDFLVAVTLHHEYWLEQGAACPHKPSTAHILLLGRHRTLMGDVRRGRPLFFFCEWANHARRRRAESEPVLRRAYPTTLGHGKKSCFWRDRRHRQRSADCLY